MAIDIHEIFADIADEWLERACSLGAKRTVWVNPATLRVSAEVRGLCESNQCGHYGKNWSCPPGSGNLADLQERMAQYKIGILFQTVHAVEDSYDFEGARDGMTAHTAVSEKIRDELNKVGCNIISESWMMGAGCCHLCEKCAYPQPCRFPKRAMAAMEACGINVVELSGEYGLPYIGPANSVTYFSLILFR